MPPRNPDVTFIRHPSLAFIVVTGGGKVSITREDVLTVDDVARLLELKPYTVKEYARRGILPGRKLGRTWRFLRPELEQAIKGLPQPPHR